MTDTLTLSKTIDAPADAVFAVLAEPAEHAAIDGTGWLRESLMANLARVAEVRSTT